jgi:uncharacterized OB-fold protein
VAQARRRGTARAPSPYTVLQVELDEGARLMSRLIDAYDRPIAIGQRVEVAARLPYRRRVR